MKYRNILFFIGAIFLLSACAQTSTNLYTLNKLNITFQYPSDWQLADELVTNDQVELNFKKNNIVQAQVAINFGGTEFANEKSALEALEQQIAQWKETVAPENLQVIQKPVITHDDRANDIAESSVAMTILHKEGDLEFSPIFHIHGKAISTNSEYAEIWVSIRENSDVSIIEGSELIIDSFSWTSRKNTR